MTTTCYETTYYGFRVSSVQVYLSWLYLLWLPTRRSASDDIVDFEAFVKQTPKTLRTSLIRLAKKNGNDLAYSTVTASSRELTDPIFHLKRTVYQLASILLLSSLES